MYENIDDLKNLINSSNLAAQAKNAYQDLDKTPIEVPTGVISVLSILKLKKVFIWVLDRDMIDPTKRSLDVRLLIKKSQLNDLITALEQILMAIKRSELTAMQFFDALNYIEKSMNQIYGSA